ncbi:9828_t:CDS:2, partial [Gigaspora rosea]
FGAFQLYGFDQFCIYATPIRPWCLQSPFPFLYQNCGFLTYYEVKQIPNFLFALPMISFSFFGIYKYANYDYKRMISLGLQSSHPLEIIK